MENWLMTHTKKPPTCPYRIEYVWFSTFLEANGQENYYTPISIIMEYLGRPEDLLRRLREGSTQKVKSCSHGAVAMLLQVDESCALSLMKQQRLVNSR